MAFNPKYSVVLKNGQQNSITATIGANCLIDIMSGTQATSPDAALGAQVILATLTGNATFAPNAAGGVLTLNSITSGTGTAAAGAGTVATWYRMKTSAGVPHHDGTVGTGATFDMNINNTSIATGQSVAVSSFTITNGQ